MLNVGIDILEIKRMPLDMCFIERFFSVAEINFYYSLKGQWKQKCFLASCWALKEAIYKAIPNLKLSFKDITIIRNKNQQPQVTISNFTIKLSLSHNKANVVAIALVS